MKVNFFLAGVLIFLGAIIAGYFLPDPLFTLPPVDFGLEPMYVPNPYVALKELAIFGFIIMFGIFIFEKIGDKKKMFRCLKCHRELEQTPDDPDYWMCYHCIKGYTTEELTGDKKQ